MEVRRPIELADQLLLRALTALQGARTRLAGDGGQTLAEYGLLLTLVSVAVVVGAVVAFRGALAGAFDGVTACLSGSC